MINCALGVTSAPSTNERLLRRARDEAEERLIELMCRGYVLSESCKRTLFDIVKVHIASLACWVPLDIYPGEEDGLSMVIHDVERKRRLEIDIPDDGSHLRVCYIDEHDVLSRHRVSDAVGCARFLNKLTHGPGSADRDLRKSAA